MSRRRRRFTLDGDEIVVDLPDVERQLVGQVLPQLREMLMAGDDPTLRRLRPPGRPDDEEAEANYRELVDDDLLLARLEAIETVEQGIDGARLDEEGVAAWMHSLNALRLVLGERLAADGVDLVELDPAGLADAGDDVVARVEIYDWMGYLLGELVDAAMGTLPD